MRGRPGHFAAPARLFQSENNSSDENVDARGYDSFALHHVSYADAFAAIQAKGFPSGLIAVNKQGASSISVMGDADSIAMISREINGIDTPTGTFHIQLQDIYAPLSILQKLGFEPQELQTGVVEGQGAAVAAQLLEAAKHGLLKVSAGPNMTLNDDEEQTLHSQRSILCTAPIYWSPRPVPAALAMSLKIKPHQLRPGYIQFSHSQGVSALFGQAGSQAHDKTFDDTSVSGWSWANTGETVLLSSLIEEQNTRQIPGTAKFQSTGIMHLVLATVTTDSDGNATAHPANVTNRVVGIDTSRTMVTVWYMDVPASDLPKLGLSPHLFPLPHQTFNTGQLNQLRIGQKWRSQISHGGIDQEIPNGEIIPILEGQDGVFTPTPGKCALQTVIRFQIQVQGTNQITFHADLVDLAPAGSANGDNGSVQLQPKRQVDAIMQSTQTLLMDSHLLKHTEVSTAGRNVMLSADRVRLTMASVAVPIVFQ